MKIKENGFEIDINKCFRDIATICAKRELELHGRDNDPMADVIDAASAYFAAMGRLSALTDEGIRELILRGE